MTSFEDSFEAALAVDAISVAIERRAAGHIAHRPVDRKVALLIPSVLDIAIPAELSLYERITTLQERIDELSEKHRDVLTKALAADRAAVPWRPARGSQCLAYEMAPHVDTLMLPGGAGSGKSEVMIAIALFQTDSARFIRKTMPELTDGIVKRIGEILGTTDGRNLQHHSWELGVPYGHRGDGVSLHWTGLADDDSRLRMQGRAVSMLRFDDLGSGEVSQADVEFVTRWKRGVSTSHKLVVMTANPPNPEAIWLREHFAPWLDPGYSGTPAKSGEIRYYRAGKEVDAGTPDAERRCCVMSTVDDNPRLIRTGYRRELENTPSEVLRERLLNNNWSAGLDNDADLQVIPSEWVDAAFARWTPEPAADTELTAVGVDVARGGKDRSAIIARYDDWFSAPIVRPGSATPDGASLGALVVEQLRGSYDASVYPDATGVGAALVDYLRSVGVHVVPIVFAGKYEALDRTRSFGFLNVRSGLWWRLREALDPANGRQIALPPDRALRAELVAPRYELRAGGKIYVESRADVVKRCGRSPDVATAVILALIEPTSNIGRGNVWAWRFEMQRRQERMANNA